MCFIELHHNACLIIVFHLNLAGKTVTVRDEEEAVEVGAEEEGEDKVEIENIEGDISSTK